MALPRIDYFDQEFVDLFHRCITQLETEWAGIPLDVRFLSVPYMNGQVPRIAIVDPLQEIGPVCDWVLYQWFNRTGDKAGLVSTFMRMKDTKHSPWPALRASSWYVIDCISGNYEGAFPFKKEYFSAKRSAQVLWLEQAGCFIGDTMFNAGLLLAEVPTMQQVDLMWKYYYPRLTALDNRTFFYLMKGFEKQGMITEVRTATIHRIYSLMDQDLKDPYVYLITIVLMIENIIGVQISDWRRVVDWIIPQPELLAIRGLLYRNNPMHMMMHYTNKWVVSLRSERNFCISLNVIGYPKKTYLMPIGRCTIPL